MKTEVHEQKRQYYILKIGSCLDNRENSFVLAGGREGSADPLWTVRDGQHVITANLHFL
jgi:hypothetical protein